MSSSDRKSACWKPGDPVWLESPNYVARSLRPEDVSDRMLAWFADPEIVLPLTIKPRNYSRESLIKYVRSFDNVSRFLLGTFVKDTGLHIGWRKTEYNAERGTAMSDIALGDKSYWGRGINLELQNVVYDFLFYSVGIKKIVEAIYAENKRSRRRWERMGYPGTVLPKKVKGPDGVSRVVMWYELSERDWRAKREWICHPIWKAKSDF